MKIAHRPVLVMNPDRPIFIRVLFIGSEKKWLAKRASA